MSSAYLDKQTKSTFDSQCFPGDEACLAKEQKRRDELKAKEDEEEANRRPEQVAEVSSQGLVCTMDGFVKMVQEGTEVSLGIISVLKEMATGLVPENFTKAINYGYASLVGAGNWLGYVLAAMYYAAVEFGFGTDACEGFGYGYWLIDQLYVLVSFMPKSEEESSNNQIDISKLASSAAKGTAAEQALAAALKAKQAMEDQQKTEVKASIDEGGNTEASASSDPNASEASADPAADGAADASASEKTF